MDFVKPLKTFFGNKITAGCLLIALGVVGWITATTYFVTQDIWAQEKEKLSEWIKIGDGTQQMQILYIRRDLIKARVEEAEDKVEANPTSEKWKSRLDERKTEFQTVEKEIKDLNKELSTHD